MLLFLLHSESDPTAPCHWHLRRLLRGNPEEVIQVDHNLRVFLLVTKGMILPLRVILSR
jgi:hypothetical protein